MHHTHLRIAIKWKPVTKTKKPYINKKNNLQSNSHPLHKSDLLLQTALIWIIAWKTATYKQTCFCSNWHNAEAHLTSIFTPSLVRLEHLIRNAGEFSL